MPNDAAEYRGYRIIWDVRQLEGTAFWRGRAAIVAPREISPNEMIQPLDGSYFASRSQAMEHVITGAKEWIDKAIRKTNLDERRTKRVLIVEDHANMRRLLSTQLSLMGFEPITAEDGTEGVRKAIAEKPDLVLLDIMMQKMDGCETAKRLRAHPATKNIPIVAATALFRQRELNSCLQAGCDDYLVKPFTSEDLEKKLRAFT
jgi:CheY-like chemotaxis protein